VNGFLRAKLATKEFTGSVRDDLVEVHVRLRARPGLPNYEGKMTVPLALYDLVCRSRYRLCEVFVEAAEFQIGQRGRFFYKRHGANQGTWHTLVADFEVLARPLGLCAPIAVARDLDWPKRVCFGARCSGGLGSVG